MRKFYLLGFLSAGWILSSIVFPQAVLSIQKAITSDNSQGSSLSSYDPDPNKICNADYSAKWFGIVSNYVWENSDGVIDACVMLSPSHQKLTKPVILVEGFDPQANYNFSAIYSIANRPNSSNEKMVEKLLSQGYDLVMVNHHNGFDAIQRNGLSLVTLMEDINYETGGKEPNILIGASMGGLVSRYALNSMEQNSKRHNVKLFVSFDSPQEGANVPLGLQSLVRFFAEGVPVDVGVAKNAWAIINTKAARQMLLYHRTMVQSNQVLESSERQQLRADLGAYPISSRRVAIADGSGQGLLQKGSNGSRLNPGNQLIQYWQESSVNGWPVYVTIQGDVFALPISNQRIFDGLLHQPDTGGDHTEKVFVNNVYPLDGSSGGYSTQVGDIAHPLGSANGVE